MKQIMKDNSEASNIGQGNQGIIVNGGSFNSNTTVVGGKNNVTVSVENSERVDVLKLLESIESQVNRLDKTVADQQSTIKMFTSTLKAEVEKPTINKPFWQANVAGLLDAARSVATVAPDLLKVARQVAEFIS